MFRKSVLGAVAVAVLISASASARPKKDDANGDPNRIICRTEGETGSRLASRKTCLTAAQWADQKRATRDAVERAQTQGYSKAN